MRLCAKLLVLMLAVALIASVLTGCGDDPMRAASGTYKGEYTKFVGDDDSGKVTGEEFWLELKADGTGIHHRGGMDYNVTWSLDGELFAMQEAFFDIALGYSGTLKDGRLDLFNADPSNPLTLEYVYNK